jgi:hypothetical protein
MNHIEHLILPSSQEQTYLEFDLDAETLALVQELAAEERVTPFEMCVALLRERCGSHGLNTDAEATVTRSGVPQEGNLMGVI